MGDAEQSALRPSPVPSRAAGGRLPVIPGRRAPVLRNTRFWGTAGLLALVSVFHYYEFLGIPYIPPATLEYALTRHATDRILFLFPMVYAGFIFGLRAGLGVAGVSFAVMLPPG